MVLASIELDLDVFSGPFDLLLTLVLREEVDLLELSLADVVLFREAPLPLALRRTVIPPADGSADPASLGEAMGRLLAAPPQISLEHVAVRIVPVAERLAHLRELLRRGSFSFDEAVAGADRMTVAVTLFALLELYKRGEVDWTQHESFGDVAIIAPAPAGADEGKRAG